MKFIDIYTRWQTKRLTIEEAAEILGVHERTFRRQCHRYQARGMQGLYDSRLEGRPTLFIFWTLGNITNTIYV